MPELVSWQGRKGLSLEESQGDPASRHKEPVAAPPGRCLCRQARRALPGLSLCSLLEPMVQGQTLGPETASPCLPADRREESGLCRICHPLGEETVATGRGDRQRPALRATANLLSPSTRAEREDTASSLAGGGAGGGGGLRAGGFEREPLT